MIKIVDVNDFTLQLYKAKSKEELTQSLGKVFTPESYQTFKEELIVLANGQFVFEGEALQKALDGKAFSVYIKVTVAPDHEKTLSKVFASIIDITEIKKAEQSIRDNEERYRKLVELSPDGIAVNVDGKAAFINTAGARMLGANSVDEIIGRAVSDFVCPASLKRVNESIAQILENGVSMKLKEEDFMRLDRITINVELSAVPITYQGKKAIQIIFRDITERKKAEGSLIEANRKIELYKRLVEFSGDGIYRYSFEEGRIIFANQGLVDILDLDCQPKELEGKLLKDVLIYTEKPGTLRKAVEGKGELRNFEYHFKTLKGQDRWVIHNSFLFDDPLGGEKTVESIVKDITKRKQTEEEIKKLYKELLKSNQRLKQLVVRDSQTGLYNYRFLTDVIEREFYRAKRYAYPFSIIMLDIDYFKSINDAYGHQFGDLVLKQLAKELKRFVRRYDIVIRYGGEEFIVISPATDRTSAVSLAQRILDALNLCNFGNRKHTIKLKLSMVAVSYPEDKVIEGMDLIKLADHVLNKVKESGGNKLYSSMDIKEVAVQEESNDIKFLRTKISKLTKRANQNLSEAIFAFAKTLEVKDHYTGEHVENTVFYATEVAKELGLSKEEAELVKQAATLHDLGKVGISEKILLKKSKLTKKEFNEIKKHPQYGADILRPIQFLHGIIPFIFYHHERWDGKGYPSGIKGSEIPLGARIIAIADVYQALTSDRPYRKAYPKKEAVKIIKRESGAQFDPAVVDAFLKVLR
jgi:diguanylate cyclase (GGDEF)-like protein/PAS domain S-box-containing protein